MADGHHLSKDELAEKFPDRDWLKKLLTILQIMEFLDECVLKPEYKIPDDLNRRIVLSDYGKRIHQDLVTKHEVPAKEARLMCFTAAVFTEPLIDVEKIDIDALAAAVSEQILNRNILLPFVFGRELYDRAAELFEDERPYLNHQDSIRLLEGTSIGVFQMGPWLCGPYGLIEAKQRRYLSPTRNVPLYHCSELTCDVVHRARLSTDSHAPINQHFGKLFNVLEKEALEPWPWGDLLRELTDLVARGYDDMSLSTLPFLLGDGLTDAELRLLIGHLMNTTGGEYRKELAPFGVEGDPVRATESLSRAHMLQLLLLARDEAIVEAIDELVLDEVIAIPAGEIRTPVVHSAAAEGQFGLQIQLGEFGYRVHSLRADVGPLRLKRLVSALYLLDQESDVTELEWQLREVDAPSLASRLEEFVRTFTPEQVVRRLVLARRTNMITACASLGLDEHRQWSDDDLVSAVLWKLDFNPPMDRDNARRFWQLHERMKQVTQTAGVSALVDQEAVRALASNYFVLLEEFLDDCLAFATWALTNDHMSALRPFSYRSTDETEAAFARLDEFEQLRESGPETIRFSGRNTLFELCRGFGSLAGLLDKYQKESDVHLRPSSDFPRFVSHTNLKTFPFLHTIPFLDLLPESQKLLLDTLSLVARTLTAADVSGVRNDQLHFRRSTADLGRLSECLGAVEDSARRLEHAGLTRLTFRPLGVQGDEWNRRILTLVDPRGREIAIARPSSFDWLSLPGLRRPQYLVTSAVFAEPNEFLRFREGVDSGFARFWEGFPARRTHGTAMTILTTSLDEQAREAAGHRSRGD